MMTTINDFQIKRRTGPPFNSPLNSPFTSLILLSATVVVVAVASDTTAGGMTCNIQTYYKKKLIALSPLSGSVVLILICSLNNNHCLRTS